MRPPETVTQCTGLGTFTTPERAFTEADDLPLFGGIKQRQKEMRTPKPHWPTITKLPTDSGPHSGGFCPNLSAMMGMAIFPGGVNIVV